MKSWYPKKKIKYTFDIFFQKFKNRLEVKIGSWYFLVYRKMKMKKLLGMYLRMGGSI